VQKELVTAFAEVFGNDENTNIYFAPGRVNLIGEHTDYNGGHVFPCALNIGTYAVARRRSDRLLRVFSMNMPQLGIIEISLDSQKAVPAADWANYPAGVAWAFIAKGHPLPYGIDMLINGEIPAASGLSSSASLEVLTGFIFRDLYDITLTNQELALLGQYAENHFIGVNCGIMDQFAIAMGKKDHAIFLDTADLSFNYVPLVLDKAKIVLANTNKPRELVESKYNERRSECERALAELQTVTAINSLGDLSEAEFENYKSAISDEVTARRARHAVYENMRTVRAVTALSENNIDSFGQLMNESHLSLRDDYQVTGYELDTLVEEAWKVAGVFGSRMTGAGFGGCTVSIVREDAVSLFIEKVGIAYEEKVGHNADFYVVDVGGGPVKLS
jgi:galactokinase